MSPNFTTWIFLAVGIITAGWYLWRLMRRPAAHDIPVQNIPVPRSVDVDSIPKPAPVPLKVERMVTQPAPELTPSLEPVLVAAAQEVAPSIDRTYELESRSEPAPLNRDAYARATTFESINAARRPNRLPSVDPADLPLADNSDYVFGSLTPILSALFPETEARQQEIRKELRHAGYYQPHALQNLNAIRYVSIMLPLIGLGFLFVLSPRQLELPFLLTMVALMIVGWAVPRLWVRAQARDRRSQIEKGRPDVLDLLNMCVSQGMTPLAAMNRVTRELHDVYPEISEELKIVAEQAQIGTMQQALENLRNRLDIPEVNSFANLMLQTERLGTSVSVALAEYAERMRESLRQRADQKANQASFKLLFPTVLCLMPAVYMFLLGPSIIELTDFFSGRNQVVNSADEAFQDYTSRYSNNNDSN